MVVLGEGDDGEYVDEAVIYTNDIYAWQRCRWQVLYYNVCKILLLFSSVHLSAVSHNAMAV
jgi:hypothetical protein